MRSAAPQGVQDPSGGCRARLAGAVSCTNHCTAIGGRGPALPREPLPPRTRKWPWARGAGLGRLAMRQAGGRGRRRRGWPRRALGGRCLPRRTAPPLHFHFLPASPAGPAYLTDCLRPSELTSQARTGCCGGKAITPLSKNKTKIDRRRLALLPRTSRRRGWGWIEASEELLGRDSRGLPPSHLPGYQKGQGETAHSAPRPLPPQTPCALSLRICNREHTSRPHDREGQTELYLQIRGRIPGCRRMVEGEGSGEVPNS